MQYIFMLTTLGGVVYLLLKRRTFDFIAIFYLSGVLYCAWAFLGYVDLNRSYGRFYVLISDDVYLILTAYFAAAFATIVVLDKSGLAGSQQVKLDSKVIKRFYADMARVSVTLSAATLLIAVSNNPHTILFAPDKLARMEELGGVYRLFQFVTTLAVLAAFISKDRVLFVICNGFLLCDLYIGFRSPFVMTYLSIIVTQAEYSKITLPLYMKWRFIVAGATLFFATAVGKLVQRSLRYHNQFITPRTVERVKHPFDLILDTEIRENMLVFVTTVDAKLDLSMEYFLRACLGFVPFGAVLEFDTRNSFNHMVQEPLLNVSNEVVGLAHSLLGEIVALGGVPLMIVFPIAWGGLLAAIARSRIRNRILGFYPILNVLLAFCSF